MKRANPRIFASFLLAVGCAAPPPSSESVNDPIIYTRHAPDVDFGGYTTFYIRPDVLRPNDDDDDLEPVDDAATGALLVSQTEQNMLDRGFEQAADPALADLGIQLLYMDQITTAYWCYSWWDPYYWGYPGWGYYPYYGACDGTAWKSQMVATVMVDLKAAREGGAGDGGGGAGGAGGAGGDLPPLHSIPGVWFSGVYGVSLGSADALSGIDQAFTQSPYIKPSP